VIIRSPPAFDHVGFGARRLWCQRASLWSVTQTLGLSSARVDFEATSYGRTEVPGFVLAAVDVKPQHARLRW